jgi:hypothetical protein
VAGPLTFGDEDETGWAWFIPLHNGTTSVGVVMNLADSIKKKKTASQKLEGTGLTHSLKDHYLSQLPLAPNISDFLKGATMVEDGSNTMKSASDFSYAASCYAGDHFRLVGDAGGRSTLSHGPTHKCLHFIKQPLSIRFSRAEFTSLLQERSLRRLQFRPRYVERSMNSRLLSTMIEKSALHIQGSFYYDVHSTFAHPG